MTDDVLVLAWRRELVLTQAQAAELLGVDRRTWVRWEGGGRVTHERGGECVWRRMLAELLDRKVA